MSIHKETLLVTPLDELMSDRFGKYSKYIIQDRALPDARDGLKPVQRRILYAMYQDGNTHDKGYRKSVKAVGLVIGNYHPHGESSVYDAMVRMSQPWKMRELLIDMHGNNGSMDDDPAAAMRYTEARLSAISESLLADIEKDTVLFASNFDDTTMEPTVLPALYPNLLVNGVTGIAAGYATNIPPHNLNEIIEATIYRVYHPYCDLDEIMQIVKGPDFPTGGTVQGIEGIRNAFRTGKGRVMVRCKSEFVETRTMMQLVITELPFEVIKSNLVRKMDEIRANKDIDGILAVRDESDRNGLRIVVDIKKDANHELILNYYLKNTDMQVYYNYNMVAIVNKRPMQMGIIPLLDAYIEHREEVIVRRTRYDLQKMEERCHILEGLIKAVSVLDEIIQIIRQSKDKQDAKKRLMERFAFTDIQAEAIVNLRLYRLTSTDIKELRNEFAQLLSQMEELKAILEDRKVLHHVLVKELQQMSEQYGSARRSSIEDLMEEIVIDKLDMIASEQVVVTLTRDGYLKRVSMRSYNASEHSMCGLKDSDQLLCYAEVDTLDKLLVFTSLGKYCYVPVFEIEETKWKEIGKHISSVVKISGEEKMVAATISQSLVSQCYVITITKQGMIKRTLLKDYEVARYSKAMVAINLKQDDEVAGVVLAYDHQEVLLLSKQGFVVRYGVSSIPLQSVKTGGVKAMNLTAGDELADVCVFAGDKNAVLLIGDKGMKRIWLEQIAVSGRPARGERVVKAVKTNPLVMKEIRMVNTADVISYVHDKEFQTLAVKDVSFMDKTATVSAVLKGEVAYLRTLERSLQVELTAEKEEEETEFQISMDELM